MRLFSTRITGIAALLAAAAISAAIPASASEGDRARQAIAEARGKVEASEKIGAATVAGDVHSQARIELDRAEDLLSHHHKTEAISAANRASMLADQATVTADRRKVGAEREGRRDAEAAAAVNGARADAAQQSAADASANAAAANQAATAAAAEASALRNAPKAAPTTTTVTTEESKVVQPTTTTRVTSRVVPARVVPAHRVTHVTKVPSGVVAEKTTTTVATGQPQ